MLLAGQPQGLSPREPGCPSATPRRGHRNAGAISAAFTMANVPSYRGRLAPSPTGYVHLGHARTFLIAAQRAAEESGTLILRNEDLDPDRCRAEYVSATYEDLQWIGLEWVEGPDCGGAYGPYSQSERRGVVARVVEQSVHHTRLQFRRVFG